MILAIFVEPIRTASNSWRIVREKMGLQHLPHRADLWYDKRSRVCSEYLFKDWEAFLDILYEEGGRVSSILWWDHCRKNLQHASIRSGGYTDPDDQEWMYAETWLHEDGFEERSLEDIKAYIREMRQHGAILGDKYITFDLVPSFYLAE